MTQKGGKHGKTLDQLSASEKESLRQKDPALSPTEQIAKDLQSHEGSQLYRLRKQTVEPVFGIIKQAMGFRRFFLRGLDKVNSEWMLVCVSDNFRRLFNLKIA